MHRKETPPKIHFYEEEPLRQSPLFSSPLTRFVRFMSFGIIRNDTQAGLLIILLMIGAGVWAYYFVQKNRPVEPTVTFELLPQESIGSSQGQPPQPTYE